MTWVKIDDQFHAHPKVQSAWVACPASLGLHLRALSYCACHLTDGHVPEALALTLLPSRAARARAISALTHAPLHYTEGLWVPGEHGWVIHDYLVYNESREKVLAERARQAIQRSAAGRSGARKRWRERSSPYGEPMAPSPSPSPNVNGMHACHSPE